MKVFKIKGTVVTTISRPTTYNEDGTLRSYALPEQTVTGYRNALVVAPFAEVAIAAFKHKFGEGNITSLVDITKHDEVIVVIDEKPVPVNE